ncbi:MAG TPA: hypothetical protein VEY67_06350, partial [Candidatus Dormibacteraeota bacterium]|nr:hypothetical protein [Candidatus Dormibacteraeota bacterium]
MVEGPRIEDLPSAPVGSGAGSDAPDRSRLEVAGRVETVPVTLVRAAILVGALVALAIVKPW